MTVALKYRPVIRQGERALAHGLDEDTIKFIGAFQRKNFFSFLAGKDQGIHGPSADSVQGFFRVG